MNYKILKKQVKREYQKLFLDTERDISEYNILKEDTCWGKDEKKYISKVYPDNNILYFFKIYPGLKITVDCVSYVKDTSNKKTIRNSDCKIYSVFNSFLPIIFNRKVYKIVKKIKNITEYKKLMEEMKDTPVDPKLLQRREKIDKILKNVKK
jgi:hypothetical protein